MKLLFHANRFPYPPYRGDKLKIYNLAQHLSKKHELHLITFLENEEDKQYLPELEKIFKTIHLVPLPKSKAIWNTLKGTYKNMPLQVAYFQMPAMQKKIDELLAKEDFDAVHIQHIRLAPYWEKKTDIPRILDLPDAFSLYWKRRIDNVMGPKKLFTQIEYKRLLKYENKLNQFDLALVCSQEDLLYLQETHGIHDIALLPNGVNTDTFPLEKHDYSQNQTVLFTGNMDYAPNVDAVVYFAEEIWPNIQLEHPNIQFIIAGQNPVDKVQVLAKDPSIKVTGFVESIADEYRKASIVVAPLRFGAGTQNKVLEAMAMGVPVISHNIGFEGLNIESGQGVILCQDSKEFIQASNRLLANEADRQSTGEAGQTVIKEHFTWEIVSQQLEKYFYKVRG